MSNWGWHEEPLPAGMKPLRKGPVTLAAPKGRKIAGVSCKGKPVELTAGAEGAVTFQAEAGQSYAVVFE